MQCINFQRKSSGDVFFINLGVHPVFRKDPGALHPRQEMDCYIRHRLQMDRELQVAWLHDEDTCGQIIEEITDKAWRFFDFFGSFAQVFDSLEIEAIESGRVPEPLQQVTKVRLAMLGMGYHEHIGNSARSCEFASYGLLVAGRATALKKEFRRVLSQANLD